MTIEIFQPGREQPVVLDQEGDLFEACDIDGNVILLKANIHTKGFNAVGGGPR